MKCHECIKEGRTSKLYSNGSTVTLMAFTPYYDEDGAYHSHDPNKRTNHYTCGNGHRFSTAFYSPCPCPTGCDYGCEPMVVTPRMTQVDAGLQRG